MERFAPFVLELQAQAVANRVWRGTQVQLIRLIAPHLPAGTPENEFVRAIRDPGVRRELYLRDVALWDGLDGKFRLIDQQPPSSIAQARRYFSLKPSRGCAFCGLDDADDEMVQMSDGGTIHNLCRRPFYRWKRVSFMGDKPDTPWWVVLGFQSPDVTQSQIKLRCRQLARDAHPDHGGDNDQMVRINLARDAGLQHCQT